MNSAGTIDLPLKTLVSLIVGFFALAIVVAYIQSLKPSSYLIVSWDKDLYEFDGNEILIEVNVMDENLKPVEGANVLIYGLGNISGGVTKNGKAIVKIIPEFEGDEGYLSIKVTAERYEKYEGIEQIKVVRK